QGQTTKKFSLIQWLVHSPPCTENARAGKHSERSVICVSRGSTSYPQGTKVTDIAPVRSQKLWHVVAAHLRSQIARGELNPGDKLTLEAELLKKFQVSRPTLREALRVLESEG